MRRKAFLHGALAALVLAWAGAVAGKLQPNPRHTYSWKKGRVLAAFANALLLLMAMGALVCEAVGQLISPAPLVGNDGLTIMAVAGVGIVVNKPASSHVSTPLQLGHPAAAARLGVVAVCPNHHRTD